MSSEVRVSQIDDSTGIGRVGKKKRGKEKNNVKKTQGVLSRMGKKAGQIKAGQTLGQTNVQTPLLPLSGTRKVVRTPTNPFEAAGTVEVFVPKEIIARRIQDIFAGPNKGRKADHYLVVWEDYPLKKDYTWEPIENLYGHEDLAQTYEQWLKTENERLDSQEAERKTERQSTAQKKQDAAADKFRKHDKMTKKTKGTNSTGKETLEVEDDEAEAAADGDDNASDDEASTGSEGVGDKRTRGRDRKTRHLKSLVYTSNSFVAIRDQQQNVVQAKCCIISECTGKACGTTVDILQSSPKACWNHLQKHHKTEFLTLKMAQVHMLISKELYVHAPV